MMPLLNLLVLFVGGVAGIVWGFYTLFRLAFQPRPRLIRVPRLPARLRSGNPW